MLQHKDVLKLLLPLQLEGVSIGDHELEGAVLDSAQARAASLLEEMFPSSCNESLPDWERVFGLPDPCTGLLPTIQQRRMAVVAKDAGVGNLSRQYFVSLAASVGVEITITEGIGGDPYTWQANAPDAAVYEFSCMSPCADPLRDWGNELLECTIRRQKPAHTNVLFSYGGA